MTYQGLGVAIPGWELSVPLSIPNQSLRSSESRVVYPVNRNVAVLCVVFVHIVPGSGLLFSFGSQVWRTQAEIS